MRLPVSLVHFQVTGEANEKQVTEALKRYTTRHLYMQKSLYTLFSLTQEMFIPREDIIKVLCLKTYQWRRLKLILNHWWHYLAMFK